MASIESKSVDILSYDEEEDNTLFHEVSSVDKNIDDINTISSINYHHKVISNTTDKYESTINDNITEATSIYVNIPIEELKEEMPQDDQNNNKLVDTNSLDQTSIFKEQSTYSNTNMISLSADRYGKHHIETNETKTNISFPNCLSTTIETKESVSKTSRKSKFFCIIQ